MKGFVQGVDRQQTTLLPECLDDWVDESNPVRAVDVFVDALELRDLGFDGVDPAATGRPAYHPSPMLMLYIYGYLNRVQSSRRLEREAGRNLEVMWLTGRLVPDHKTIADFRKDNGPAIKKACAQFVELCRKMGLLAKASVAIDGSKFKAVNSRDNNFTQGKIKRRQKQIEESVARYMSQLDTADRRTAAGEEPSETVLLTKTRLKEKLSKLEEEVKRLAALEKALLASPDKQISLTDPDCRSMATSGRGSGMVAYNVQSAVDTTNHLIVAHEVTNVGTDRSQLATMAQAAKAALCSDHLDVVADRGYFKGEELLACEQAGYRACWSWNEGFCLPFGCLIFRHQPNPNMEWRDARSSARRWSVPQRTPETRKQTTSGIDAYTHRATESLFRRLGGQDPACVFASTPPVTKKRL